MRSAALLVARQKAATAAAEDRLSAALPAGATPSAACLPAVELRVVETREGEEGCEGGLQEIRVHRTRTRTLTLLLTLTLNPNPNQEICVHLLNQTLSLTLTRALTLARALTRALTLTLTRRSACICPTASRAACL